MSPYGDHITYIVVKIAEHMFSPPYGDHMKREKCYLCTYGFSPPYGDHIAQTHYNRTAIGFSPPYGDHILNISQPIEKRKSQKVGKCLLYCNAVNLHKCIKKNKCRLSNYKRRSW